MVFESGQDEEGVVGGCGGEKGLEGRVEAEMGLGREYGAAGGCCVGGGSLDEESLGVRDCDLHV